MANWQHKIQLNEIIEQCSEEFDLERHEEPCPDVVKERLAVEVAKALPIAHFAGRIRTVNSIAELNRVLARLFDDADRHSVWCGGFGT